MNRDDLFARRDGQAKPDVARPTPKITRPITPEPIAPAASFKAKPVKTVTPRAVPKAKREWKLPKVAITKRRLMAMVIVIAAVVGIALAWGLTMRGPVLPDAIKRQADFSLYTPSTGFDAASANYDTSQNTVSFAAGDITIKEMATPTEFTTVTGYADRVYTGFNQYGTFESDLGTVHLTRPGGNSGADVAVVERDGTLLFLSAPEKMSEADWKTLVNSLELVT